MFKILMWCNFEPIGVFDEILCGYDDIRDDIDSMLFSPVVSTVSKLCTFKLLRRVHLLNQLVDLDEILYCGNGIKADLDYSKMALSLTNNF
jgi:hypothetical protein